MELGIKNRIALVTGGGGGIGRETARMLLQEGVTVALSDLPGDELDQSKSELDGLGKMIVVPADLTKKAAVDDLFAEVTSELGDPDILVNCAGVTGATGEFTEMGDDGWEETLEINLMSAVRTARAAIPAMRKKGWGRVVLIGSEDAWQPYPVELPYCASKAGIITLAKGLSKQYGPDNVLVNTVSPAFIETPMTDAMMEKRADEKGVSFEEAIETFLEEERPGMALKRRGKPEEVAAAIVFLCSEQASFINGTDVRVDSGSVRTI